MANCHVLLMGLVLAGGCRLAAAASSTNQAATAPEKQKIEALISAVENLKDATFIRNDREYDAKAAADHLRTKWLAAGDRIKTARDFIRYIASSSSQSGQPYLIRFKDGTTVKSSDFLTAQLEKIERAAAASRPAG